MTYVLLEVGCLECDEPTRVLGIYTDRLAADAVFEGTAEQHYPGPFLPDDDRFLNGTAIRVTPYGRLQLHDTTKETT